MVADPSTRPRWSDHQVANYGQFFLPLTPTFTWRRPVPAQLSNELPTTFEPKWPTIQPARVFVQHG